MAETTALPTADNTVAEIKAYLDAAGISYSSSATKSELLGLIPGDEAEAAEAASEEAASEADPTPAPEPAPEPAPAPVRQEPYYTKAELLCLVHGRQHDYFLIVLKNGRTYTYKEAIQAVDDWMNSGTIF